MFLKRRESDATTKLKDLAVDKLLGFEGKKGLEKQAHLETGSSENNNTQERKTHLRNPARPELLRLEPGRACPFVVLLPQKVKGGSIFYPTWRDGALHLLTGLSSDLKPR